MLKIKLTLIDEVDINVYNFIKNKDIFFNSFIDKVKEESSTKHERDLGIVYNTEYSEKLRCVSISNNSFEDSYDIECHIASLNFFDGNYTQHQGRFLNTLEFSLTLEKWNKTERDILESLVISFNATLKCFLENIPPVSVMYIERIEETSYKKNLTEEFSSINLDELLKCLYNKNI